jgi:uncharacterized RDD family membrane protein YckC
MVLDDVFSESKDKARAEIGRHSASETLSETLDKSLAAPIDRLAATIVDFILAVPVITLIIAPLTRRAKEAQVLGADEAWLASVLWAIAVGAFALIVGQTIAVAIFGATPGKHILKLRVVSVWTGERPLAIESFARALMWCLELGFLGVPLLSVFSNHRRRPFHDRIAETAVISLTKSRRAGLAGPQERSVFSGFQAACLAVVLFGLSANFIKYQRHHDATLEAALLREDAGRLCPEVRDTIRESSARTAGRIKDRLEVALMLYNSGSFSTECLDAEAEFALWQSQTIPLAYLAKGLAVSETDEIAARAYLEKACEKARMQENANEFADVCLLGTLARAGLDSAREDESAIEPENEPENDADEVKLAILRRETEVESVLSALDSKTKTYLKIAALRNMLANGEDERALPILDNLNEAKSLGAFVAGERAKILWRLGRKSEALAAMRSITALSDRPARVETARWFCFNETEFGHCSEGSLAACSEFKAGVDGDTSFLKKPDVVVAYIRAKNCAVDKPEWRELAGKTPLLEAKDYLESLALLAEGNVDGGIAKLRSVAENRQARSHSIFIEANTKLIDRTESHAELEVYRVKWEHLKPSAVEWRALGRHLLNRLSHFRDFDEAINVGLRMLRSDPGDRETYKLMILAAKNGGKLRMALGLLEQIPGRKPASEAGEESP